MPVEVNILEEGRGVEILATGVVYGYEILEANEEIISNKNLGNIQYHLIDKSACTKYNVTTNDILKISEFDRLFAQANPNIIMAIVESKALRFSMTTLWQIIIKKYDFRNNSFKDRDAALKWIKGSMGSDSIDR